ncbi:hypothetical protein A3D77_07700 [Candidatus Gottesmanbacteria bacterium RIFCSPHIGHO2_02_FULL_39_11]|uniref:Uncharacterized protein n=1 Tax=Candidatus Gottesmanbacteria bacterium RIFCSPHIGHO2_02_FULL_39_11 TaxID=1798382 RepID=A0A1F5ZST0_9BACT|nr:MAG: hypothetical protein A3D77_07700 [Candidatus Gottesmanbacteria bacterium RIFCSPHIGHO2_02_FULL_39_11]
MSHPVESYDRRNGLVLDRSSVPYIFAGGTLYTADKWGFGTESHIDIAIQEGLSKGKIEVCGRYGKSGEIFRVNGDGSQSLLSDDRYYEFYSGDPEDVKRFIRRLDGFPSEMTIE